MNLTTDIENVSGNGDVPDSSLIRAWVEAAILADLQGSQQRDEAELSIRIVDETESQSLNQRYRSQDKPTNVLSFPSDLPAELQLPLLGDLVVCAPVVEREAQQQQKSSQAHWAHMLIHGTLHLLGYEHNTDSDAEQMEALEATIITGLGFPHPYHQTSSQGVHKTP